MRIPHMMKSVETLRKNAEQTLCSDCIHTYQTDIEPNIKKILLDTINDWRSTENYITRMVMTKKENFKTDLELISIDNGDNKKSDDEDAKLHKKIQGWPFYRKIIYLKNEKLIPESCYEFLSRAKNIRNNIHEDPFIHGFTEKDLELLNIAHYISANLYSSISSNWSEEIKETMISKCEQISKKYNSNG